MRTPNADRLIDRRLQESRAEMEKFVWDNINPGSKSADDANKGIVKLNTTLGYNEVVPLGDLPDAELRKMAQELGYTGE